MAKFSLPRLLPLLQDVVGFCHCPLGSGAAVTDARSAEGVDAERQGAAAVWHPRRNQQEQPEPHGWHEQEPS